MVTRRQVLGKFSSFCATKPFTAWMNTRYQVLPAFAVLKYFTFCLALSSLTTAQVSNSSSVSVPIRNGTDESSSAATPLLLSTTAAEEEYVAHAYLKTWNLKCQNKSCIVQYNSSFSNVKTGLDWIKVVFGRYKTNGNDYLTMEDLELFMKSIGSFRFKKIDDSAYYHHSHEGHDHDEDHNDHEPYEEDYESEESGDDYYDYDDPCLKSVTELLDEYYPNIAYREVKITLSDFSFILPRLFYHLFISGCVDTAVVPFPAEDDHHHDSHEEEDQVESSGKVWGIALVSVAVISLLSLIGIMIVPLMGRSNYFQRLLSFLVALAVGTLIGDALLHLLPHAMGGHEEGHAHDGEAGAEERDRIVKSLVAVLGVYIFFVFESVMAMMRKLKRRQKLVTTAMDITSNPMIVVVPMTKSEEQLMSKSPASSEPLLDTPDSSSSSNRSDDVMVKSLDSGISSSSTGYKLSSRSSSNSLKAAESDIAEEKLPLHSLELNLSTGNEAELKMNSVETQKAHDPESRHPHHHHGDIANAQGIKDLAWMIIAGDGLHNFSDGLAIGAAFSSSISAGLSTSLAIFCHELPHELGDFAILIDAGMSIKKALLYNGLCACLAFIGAVLGLLVGEYTTSVKLWILALTAGGFLYVALVDMLPQMLKHCVEKDGFTRFCYQNVGFLVGVTIMLLIAWYEGSFLMVFNVPHGH